MKYNDWEVNILFRAHECDYEEGWSVTIYEKDGKYYQHSEGCIPSACSHWDETNEITSEEALEVMLENADHEDTSYLMGYNQ